MLNPEDQVLSLCAFPHENHVDREALVRLISHVKDWEALIDKAASHKLQPRLYSFLKRTGVNVLLPPEIWEKIELDYGRAQAYTLALEEELTSVLLPEFEKAGIDVLLLKGAALLQTVYRKRPIRFFMDLDLLIRPEALSKAKALLEELGYEGTLVQFPSRWHEKEVYSRIPQVYFPFFHIKKRLLLDLHLEPFEITSGFSLPSCWLWEGAQLLSIGRSHAFLPSPEKLFLHLLFHLAKHKEARQGAFAWYLDLDECLRTFRGQIDGRLLREVTGSHPQQEKLVEILCFLDEYFSSPFPEEIQSLLQEKKAKAPSLETIFSSFEKSELASLGRPEGNHRLEQFLFYWNEMPDLQKKVMFFLRWLFPDRQYLETKYPFWRRGWKLLAYAKHLLTISLKGASLGIKLIFSLRHKPILKVSPDSEAPTFQSQE